MLKKEKTRLKFRRIWKTKRGEGKGEGHEIEAVIVQKHADGCCLRLDESEPSSLTLTTTNTAFFLCKQILHFCSWIEIASLRPIFSDPTNSLLIRKVASCQCAVEKNLISVMRARIGAFKSGVRMFPLTFYQTRAFRDASRQKSPEVPGLRSRNPRNRNFRTASAVRYNFKPK